MKLTIYKIIFNDDKCYYTDNRENLVEAINEKKTESEAKIISLGKRERERASKRDIGRFHSHLQPFIHLISQAWGFVLCTL